MEESIYGQSAPDEETASEDETAWEDETQRTPAAEIEVLRQALDTAPVGVCLEYQLNTNTGLLIVSPSGEVTPENECNIRGTLQVVTGSNEDIPDYIKILTMSGFGLHVEESLRSTLTLVNWPVKFDHMLTCFTREQLDVRDLTELAEKTGEFAQALSDHGNHDDVEVVVYARMCSVYAEYFKQVPSLHPLSRDAMSGLFQNCAAAIEIYQAKRKNGWGTCSERVRGNSWMSSPNSAWS